MSDSWVFSSSPSPPYSPFSTTTAAAPSSTPLFGSTTAINPFTGLPFSDPQTRKNKSYQPKKTNSSSPKPSNPASGLSSGSTPSFVLGANISVPYTCSSSPLSSVPSLFGPSSSSFSSSTTSFSFKTSMGSAPTTTSSSSSAGSYSFKTSMGSAPTTTSSSSSAGSYSFKTSMGSAPTTTSSSSSAGSYSFGGPASTTAPLTNPGFGLLFIPPMSTTSNITFSGPAPSTVTTTSSSTPSLFTSHASASAPAFGGTSFPTTTSLTSAAKTTTPASAAATTPSFPSFSLPAKATAPASQSSALPQTSTAKISFGFSAGDADPSTSFSYLGSGSRLMHHVSQIVEESREFALHHFNDADRLQRIIEEQRHEISTLRQECDFMIVERGELERNLESARNDLQFKEVETHLEHEKLVRDLKAAQDATRAAEAALEAQQRRNASSDTILGRMTADYQFQKDRYRELYQYCMEAGIELSPHFGARTP